MTTVDPQAARQFAIDVVAKLRAAQFEALWAGGCVRDDLLRLTPKDYDVATSARPEQVREVFGRRRTLAIGQSFGVITVLGPKEAGQIDVATFRRDATYSDGRHPDSVAFSTAEFDAQRRDFTINGLFFDPLENRVIDYVGGQEDLERRVIRAIGDPAARIAEDKLRMLRAIRFAATFDFNLEAATLHAIQEQSHELVIVSAERIAAEMRRMLVHANRSEALALLQESGLLEVILPESVAWFVEDSRHKWLETQQILERLSEPTFASALAGTIRLLRPEDEAASQFADTICRRWKLSNEEREGVGWLLENELLVLRAREAYWPQLQRALIDPRIGELLKLAAAIAQVNRQGLSEIDFCRQKLALSPKELDPPPLINGEDLKALGLKAGPRYRELLHRVRDAQLLGQITSREQAIELLGRLANG